MAFLSCLTIGLMFLLAVGLLLFASVLLGWYVPALLERARGTGPPPPGVGPDPAAGPDPPPAAPSSPEEGKGLDA